MTNTLRLPSTYVEVSDNEMEYLDGGWKWSWKGVLGIVGGIVAVATSCIACQPLGIIGGGCAIIAGFCEIAEID